MSTTDCALVVGLGNPGASYRGTRHNVGFAVLDLLAHRRHLSFARDRECRSALAMGELGQRHFILQMPLTYMNLSGEAVSCLLRKKKWAPSQLLVVVDDAALPLGSLRLREQGSAGGHNGLKSIETHLQTDAYARLRVGIGSPLEGEDLADYVLSSFSSEEKKVLPALFERAAEAVEIWLQEGIASAMKFLAKEHP